MDKQERRKLIGETLQKHRKAAGFKSANAFAIHMGYNPSTYTDWEQGRHMFSWDQACEMADFFHVTLDELGGREWPPGGAEALTSDERGLVDSYRKMDPPDREKLRGVADTFVVASEKDGPGAVRDVERTPADLKDAR